MHFEMSKSLAFARNFFRFIVRKRPGLVSLSGDLSLRRPISMSRQQADDLAILETR
jgi:hypothetical protein